MKKIGLISDTHGELHERVKHYFADCDEIWHAGDIGSLNVIEALNTIAPVKAVYGNIDNWELRKELPDYLNFNCEDVNVFITHIGGYPGKYAPGVRKMLADVKPDLFISGHSHILKVMYDKQLWLLHMNPGAAGNLGFHSVRTILTFNINGGKIENLEVIELCKRG